MKYSPTQCNCASTGHNGPKSTFPRPVWLCRAGQVPFTRLAHLGDDYYGGRNECSEGDSDRYRKMLFSPPIVVWKPYGCTRFCLLPFQLLPLQRAFSFYCRHERDCPDDSRRSTHHTTLLPANVHGMTCMILHELT